MSKPNRLPAAMLLLLTAGSAYGACTLVRVPADQEIQGQEVIYTFPNGRVSIPRNLPVGSVIARAPIRSITKTGQALQCQPGDRVRETVNAATDTRNDGINGYLRRGDGSMTDAGVAYRVLQSDGNPMQLTSVSAWPTNGGAWGSSAALVRRYAAEIVLVKTSDVVHSGTVFPAGLKRRINAVDFNNAAGGRLVAATMTTTNSVTIVPQTCEMTSPATVSLGNHRRTAFTGVGSTTPTTSFRISIDCTGVQTAVHMTMSDPSNVANRSSTLPLTSTSTASGIGVQILRGSTDTLVSFGPDSAVAGNPNQFKLFDATAATPTHIETFRARYVQTAEKVEPGTANSVVTMTMSYQ
ncbi:MULTISPECIES: fimbrial protein [unclassified Herbaspirillum]|uniref:fimbrial protein n=1 Tax=unclassified Herbaspirillum TaxID=2624150 RepID=UPI0011692C79|nr:MULTISPECIES: fimbrial protein [unclassified Herbaspirillum]MBB5392710.1 type 1 fimbria pilin [Herbaspirillum sp. SJZ102]TQK06345.1 type 1 fimbria pilin [Herbaspirillum sp. SJZ130]